MANRRDALQGPSNGVGIEWQVAGIAGLVGALSMAVGFWWWQGPVVTGAEHVALGLALGVVVGYMLARPVKRDLRHLTLTADLLARGQWEVPPEPVGTAEVGYVRQQLAQMARAVSAQVEALRRVAEQRTALEERARQAAVLEERQRLARELHDTVSQELFGLAMVLAALERSLDNPDGDLADRLRQAEAGAQRAQVTMRGLIRALRPIELGEQDLETALRLVLADVRDRHGILGTVEFDAVPDLSPAVEDAVFRVAQEAIANAVRHAQPQHLIVRLAHTPDRLILEVADDGRGFDVLQTAPHIGLASMRERADELGGQLHVRSFEGRGTTVALWIPVIPTHADSASDGAVSDET